MFKTILVLIVSSLFILSCSSEDEPNVSPEALAQQKQEAEKQKLINEETKNEEVQKEDEQLKQEASQAKQVKLTFDPNGQSLEGTILIRNQTEDKITKLFTDRYYLVIGRVIDSVFQITAYDLTLTNKDLTEEQVAKSSLNALVPPSMLSQLRTAYIRTYDLETGDYIADQSYDVTPKKYSGLDTSDPAYEQIKVIDVINPLVLRNILSENNGQEFPLKPRNIAASPFDTLEIPLKGTRYYYNKDINFASVQAVRLESGELFEVIKFSNSTLNHLNDSLDKSEQDQPEINETVDSPPDNSNPGNDDFSDDSFGDEDYDF